MPALLLEFDPKTDLADTVTSAFYINGAWVAPSSPATRALVSPCTEQAFMTVPDATVEDMDKAIAAARHAFDHGPWPRMAMQERAAYVAALGREIEQRIPLLVQCLAAEVGSPQGNTAYGCAWAASLFRYYGEMGMAGEPIEEQTHDNSRVRIVQEPVGVVAAITPWNSPCSLTAFSMAPALLAGCTYISKPAAETPLTGMLLAQCAEAAGLPPGVVNVVHGGREVGEYLVSHRDIDKVSFTGSVAAGRRIGQICADRLARCTLELGGKSAALVLDDADVNMVAGLMAGVGLMFSGQVCFIPTRLIVPRHRQNEIADALAANVAALGIGDPWDAQTRLGPVSSKAQYDRVMAYIAKGKAEGARLIIGGTRAPGFDRGYYIAPTIFADVTATMTIAREEIFGPVISIMPYDSEEEALRIANDSDYGLNGIIFARDEARAYALARQIRTGNVNINTFDLQPSVPFGGFKFSGIGRSGGREGLKSYQETKAIYLPKA